jgi:hypothetical protein
MYYVLCIMYYVLCIMYYVLCIMYYVLCIMSYVLCVICYVLCVMCYVLCIRIMYYVLCIKSTTADSCASYLQWYFSLICSYLMNIMKSYMRVDITVHTRKYSRRTQDSICTDSLILFGESFANVCVHSLRRIPLFGISTSRGESHM